MKITILYFASLRDQIGKANETLELQETSTVTQAWQYANSDCAIPTNTLVAVNQNYVGFDTELCDGDEVAFFPPVTGG